MNKFITATGAVIIVASTLLPTAANVANAVPRTSYSESAPSYATLENMQFFGQNVKLVAVSSPSTQAKLTSFKDVKAGSWYEVGIKTAVQKGYVSGYPDGTFKPDQFVSRSEFIKMVVAAVGYNLEPAQAGQPWYTNYVKAAVEGGILSENEFGANGYTAPMKRSEMARVAVRAINQDATDDASYILLAAKAGLLTGTGNGNLDLNATTTRAQSVAIIERILTVRAGGKLPVDQDAVNAAQDAISGKKDPWGRAIRTTNLPSNAAEYPYILKDVPNEMYEMPQVKGPKSATYYSPAYLFSNPMFSKAGYDTAVKRVEDYYSLILNIDYSTIDSSWADKVYDLLYTETMNEYSKQQLKNVLNSCVTFYKQHKIRTSGSVEVEPSMIYSDGPAYFRSKFSFKIVSADNTAVSSTDDGSLFFGQSFNMKKIDPKVGVTYSGYADIDITGDSGFNLADYYPTTNSDITFNYRLVQ